MPQFNHIRAGLVEAQSLRASSINVVDSDTKTRIEMRLAGEGHPVIALYDKDGVPRLLLLINQMQDGLIMFASHDETPRIAIGMNRDGLPAIQLFDTESVVRAEVAVESTGSAIKFLDSDGQRRASAGVTGKGRPFFEFRNSTGEHHATITVPADGSDGLIVKGRDGIEQLILTEEPNG